jgi:hypothetical protein
MHALIGTELSRLRASDLATPGRHVRARRVRTTRVAVPPSPVG